ncbi:MAG: family 1 glycosylhydrolase [Sphingomicrobium sp.]
MLNSEDRLEIWGGAECTICRLGNVWRNQSRETGHHDRETDLDQIAELGIKTIRFPLLWEAAVGCVGATPDFSWADDRVARAQRLGIDLIAGLVHHGSGPAGTDLLDRNFPDLVADYAALVAERYPTITKWTPINEPLTTARFAGLYGHWYPHHHSFDSFVRMTVNQCLAVLRSMKRVREIIPGAQLIQTEDIGKSYASPDLQYQADVENERRWISLDLLFGRVTPEHSWHKRLINAGISQDELDEFALGEGRPDIVGINYYLTSERYLDSATDNYPGHDVGGNAWARYVDCEAVRIPRLQSKVGLAQRIHDVWTRYQSPLAITEVHHGCTREEQIRWLDETWRTAVAARGDGVDLRAMTAWSLFGNVDWRSLLTREEGYYDVGAFDTRSSPPRPTAVAKALAQYARGEPHDHPALTGSGWWNREDRFYSGAGKSTLRGTPVLILGATGTLGQALARQCEHRGLAHRLLTRREMDLDSKESIRSALELHRPWAVINAAGFVRVADAENEEAACFRANAEGVRNLAEAARDAGVKLVSFSSDLVFDGANGPYDEDAHPNPTGVYGTSKATAERALLHANTDNLMIRTAAFFGPWDAHNFAEKCCQALEAGETFEALSNVIVSPAYVPDLCHAALDLLIDDESGIWNVTNGEAVSWHEFAVRVARAAGLDAKLIRPVAGAPSNTALISSRGQIVGGLSQAIDDFVVHRPRLMPEASPVPDRSVETRVPFLLKLDPEHDRIPVTGY